MDRAVEPPATAPACAGALEEECERLLARVEDGAPDALALARWMAEHPELALEERGTSERYAAWLRDAGFEVRTGVAGMETAFVAEHGAPHAPLCAALLAEMDALPDLGHACGHNLSGPASLLAATALAGALPPALLRLRVVGCPAEEIGVGKRRLVEAGAFQGVHAALMAHAADMRRAHRLFLGNQKLEIVYRGRASHAAAFPEEGINALDGVVALFVGLGLLRQQLAPGVRVHGVISDGGRAPNIIPERAAARVWVRALDPAVLEDATERVIACARGAATQAGAEVEIAREPGSSPPMRPSPALAAVYGRALERLGVPESGHAPDRAIGSSDITHVSRVVPTIHPNFPIGERLRLHTRDFERATRTPQGEAGLLEAARALALSVHELARVPASREAVARGFEEGAA